MAASSGTITRCLSTHSYPRIGFLPQGSPLSNRLRMPHFTLSEMLRLSSCAKLARMVSINSPSPESELMFSFSKRTSMPRSFKCRTVSNRSTVLRANLEMLLQRMMSIAPALQSASIRWNSCRLQVSVPETKLSAYTPAYSHSGFF